MAAAKRRGPVRKFFGTLGRAFAILIFIGIITGSIVVSVMALYIFDSLEGAPVVDLSNVEVNLNNTSYIYVTDPETQEETIVKELYSGQNREWVSYDQIPEMLVNVTIAAEDKRFLGITAWTGCEPSVPPLDTLEVPPVYRAAPPSPSRSSRT